MKVLFFSLAFALIGTFSLSSSSLSARQNGVKLYSRGMTCKPCRLSCGINVTVCGYTVSEMAHRCWVMDMLMCG